VGKFSKNYITFFLPNKLSLSSQKYGFGIRDPRFGDAGSGKNLFRIPYPGVKKAPDPGSGSATLITVLRAFTSIAKLPLIQLRYSRTSWVLLLKLGCNLSSNPSNLYTSCPLLLAQIQSVMPFSSVTSYLRLIAIFKTLKALNLRREREPG
jgi:hypothetical protein